MELSAGVQQLIRAKAIYNNQDIALTPIYGDIRFIDLTNEDESLMSDWTVRTTEEDISCTALGNILTLDTYTDSEKLRIGEVVELMKTDGTYLGAAYLVNIVQTAVVTVEELNESGLGQIIVSGAGQEIVNGVYVEDGTYNGYPIYWKDNYKIYRNPSYDNWSIGIDGNLPSYSTPSEISVFDNPIDVDNWGVDSLGTLPIPTLSWATDEITTTTSTCEFNAGGNIKISDANLALVTKLKLRTDPILLEGRSKPINTKKFANLIVSSEDDIELSIEVLHQGNCL